jgi:hypothetical protein
LLVHTTVDHKILFILQEPHIFLCPANNPPLSHTKADGFQICRDKMLKEYGREVEEVSKDDEPESG